MILNNKKIINNFYNQLKRLFKNKPLNYKFKSKYYPMNNLKKYNNGFIINTSLICAYLETHKKIVISDDAQQIVNALSEITYQILPVMIKLTDNYKMYCQNNHNQNDMTFYKKQINDKYNQLNILFIKKIKKLNKLIKQNIKNEYENIDKKVLLKNKRLNNICLTLKLTISQEKQLLNKAQTKNEKEKIKNTLNNYYNILQLLNINISILEYTLNYFQDENLNNYHFHLQDLKQRLLKSINYNLIKSNKIIDNKMNMDIEKINNNLNKADQLIKLNHIQNDKQNNKIIRKKPKHRLKHLSQMERLIQQNKDIIHLNSAYKDLNIKVKPKNDYLNKLKDYIKDINKNQEAISFLMNTNNEDNELIETLNYWKDLGKQIEKNDKK